MDLTHLQDLNVLDQSEQPHRIGALWEERTTVLVFVRHFG